MVAPERQPSDDPLAVKESGAADKLFKQLNPVCRLTDAEGNSISDAVGSECPTPLTDPIALPRGTYHYTVEARCQPKGDQTIHVNERFSDPADKLELSPRIPLPEPETRYITKSSKQIWLFPDALAFPALVRELDAPDLIPAPYQRTVLPPNSKVQIVRRWPDKVNQCTKAIIRVVDAGGKARPGTLLVADLDQLSTTMVGPSAAEAVAAEEASRARVMEERRQEATARSERESREGRCDPDRSAQLQATLQDAKSLFRGISDSSELFRLDVYKILAATPNGASVSARVAVGGEIHVFAFGYEKLKLDVKDAEGNSAAIGSPYEMLMSNLGGSISSRLIQVNSGETFTARLQGLGCVLVAAFRRF
jgi:hypothetical protein